jgi:hypothetical protein
MKEAIKLWQKAINFDPRADIHFALGNKESFSTKRTNNRFFFKYNDSIFREGFSKRRKTKRS